MTQRADGKATAIPNRLPRWASGVAYAACGWAFVFAALNCYWALGGTAGAQTISPAIVALARAHDPLVYAVLWLGALVKVISGVVVLALIQPWGRRIPRWLLLLLAWGAGTLLFVHGGLFLGVGLLSMAVGLLRPTAGQVKVFGIDVWAQAIRAKALLGVLPDGLALPERLTGRELLTFLGRLRGLDPTTVAQRRAELLSVTGLTKAERTLVIDYSTGMRKKIGLASALLHNPKLLVLDEPFEAVDPISAATLKTILQRNVSAGGTVVLSSHVMALVEQVCDSVAVIANGSVAVAGPLDRVSAGRSLEETFMQLVCVSSVFSR